MGGRKVWGWGLNEEIIQANQTPSVSDGRTSGSVPPTKSYNAIGAPRVLSLSIQTPSTFFPNPGFAGVEQSAGKARGKSRFPSLKLIHLRPATFHYASLSRWPRNGASTHILRTGGPSSRSLARTSPSSLATPGKARDTTSRRVMLERFSHCA